MGPLRQRRQFRDSLCRNIYGSKTEEARELTLAVREEQVLALSVPALVQRVRRVYPGHRVDAGEHERTLSL